MAMVDVHNSNLQADSRPIGWLGLRVGTCLSLFYYIHQMNQVNCMSCIT